VPRGDHQTLDFMTAIIDKMDSIDWLENEENVETEKETVKASGGPGIPMTHSMANFLLS